MSITYGPKKLLRSATAGANHVSSDNLDALTIGRAVDLALYTSASVQLIWSGLTGTINGVLTVEVSDDGTNWDTKKIGGSDATITVSGAAGNDTLSLDGIVTERYYRVNWAKNLVTGGTLDCILIAKD